MSSYTIDGIDILLWSHPTGLSAFAAPFVLDLEYDDRGRATVDACRTSLAVEEYARRIDRYHVLDAPARVRILKAALARREEDRDLTGGWEQYLVRLRQPGLDESAFLRIVASTVEAWRRSRR